MAPKKSVRKASKKKPLKSKSVPKKKPVKKKGKNPGTSKSGSVKKKATITKSKSKKKPAAKQAVSKKKVTTKKTVTKQASIKSSSSKPSGKKASKTKSVRSSTKASSKPQKASTQKTSSRSPKKPVRTGGVARPSKRAGSPASAELTNTERYNLGGLFACAIERVSDPNFDRLRAALRELDLTSLEKDNLIRLSQGFTIPKLFADGIPFEKANSIVQKFVKFGKGEGNYEHTWREEIRQVASWLGVIGDEVESIERGVRPKK